jgi:hypothetical protein
MDRDYLTGEYFKLGLKYSAIHELFLGQQLIPYQDTSSATNGIRAFGHAFHIVLAQIMLSVEYHSYISGGKVQISL